MNNDNDQQDTKKFGDSLALALTKYLRIQGLLGEMRDLLQAASKNGNLDADGNLQLRLVVANLARRVCDDGLSVSDETLNECAKFADDGIDAAFARSRLKH